MDDGDEAHPEYLQKIQVLVSLNNKYYREPELSLSIDASISVPGREFEKVFNMADDAIYCNKNKNHRRREDH